MIKLKYQANNKCIINIDQMAVIGEFESNSTAEEFATVANSYPVALEMLEQLKAEKAELVEFVNEIATYWSGNLSDRAVEILNKLTK